jgi:hypothetical protein
MYKRLASLLVLFVLGLVALGSRPAAAQEPEQMREREWRAPTACPPSVEFGCLVTGSGGWAWRADNFSTANGAFALFGRIRSATPGANSAAVRGENLGTNGNGYGVLGSHEGSGVGVYGYSNNGIGFRGYSNTGTGMYGSTNSTGTQPGVLGVHTATSGSTSNSAGVRGVNNHPSLGYGVEGQGAIGVRGNSTNGNGAGVRGDGTNGGVVGVGGVYGVYGESSAGAGVWGKSTTDSGVYGTSTDGYGVRGTSTNDYGVYGESTNSFGVRGFSDDSYGVSGASIDSHGVAGSSTNDYGVQGFSTHDYGVYGESTNSSGVYGTSTDIYGVWGVSTDSNGVYGSSTNSEGVAGVGTIGVSGYSWDLSGAGVRGGGQNGGVAGVGNQYGVYGEGKDGIIGKDNGGAGSRAGYFDGNVQVDGTLTKLGGSFRIDHPLDPENQYLSHSFVESPDMMNVYNGNVVLDANGEAWVELPSYFQALNRDFRYQLTPLGPTTSVLYVAEKIEDNRFKIGGGAAGLEVSWQVTGIRQDAWANENRIPVEEPKLEDERGTYLYPQGFGQPEERGVNYEHEQRMQELHDEAPPAPVGIPAP